MSRKPPKRAAPRYTRPTTRAELLKVLALAAKHKRISAALRRDIAAGRLADLEVAMWEIAYGKR